MDPRIIRIAKATGLPADGGKCPKGHAWFDSPSIVQRYFAITLVIEYIQAEFGIPQESEKAAFTEYLKGIHSGFAWRLSRGEKLESIKFPMEALDHKFSFKGQISPDVFVEAFRRQFA